MTNQSTARHDAHVLFGFKLTLNRAGGRALFPGKPLEMCSDE